MEKRKSQKKNFKSIHQLHKRKERVAFQSPHTEINSFEHSAFFKVCGLMYLNGSTPSRDTLPVFSNAFPTKGTPLLYLKSLSNQLEVRGIPLNMCTATREVFTEKTRNTTLDLD